MLPFKKILFPIDFSDPCAAIVPAVADMLLHYEAQLALVHAYGPEALAYSALPITDPRLPEETRELQEERMSQFAAKHFPGVPVELYTGVGEPASVVEDVVKREGADLVMLPTHGRGALRRLILGSVTSKILHDLTVPVWTGHATKVPYKSVLCALDTSGEGEVVLRAACAIAKSYNAELAITTVLELPPPSMEMDYGAFRSDFENMTDERIRELKSRTSINVPHTIVDGLVPEAIREEALRVHADLIVTGRGLSQGTFSRAWSHLYPIIRHAPCPVLSI